jgi:GH35 family endo-1,4-beta-xylanase
MRRLAKRAGIEFGTAVNMDLLPADALYRAKVAEQFSSVTPENVMKWEVVEPQRGQFNWSPVDALVDFARQSRQRVRGYTLVWHNQPPEGATSDTGGETFVLLGVRGLAELAGSEPAGSGRPIHGGPVHSSRAARHLLGDLPR